MDSLEEFALIKILLEHANKSPLVAIVLLVAYYTIKYKSTLLALVNKVLERVPYVDMVKPDTVVEIDALKLEILDLNTKLSNISNNQFLSFYGGIENHAAKLYMTEIGIVLEFTSQLRVSVNDDLKEYLMLVVHLIKTVKLGSKKITFDLSEVEFINSDAITHLSDVMTECISHDEIQFVYEFPPKNTINKVMSIFQKNLEKLLQISYNGISPNIAIKNKDKEDE